jgi:hypothetical protein
VSRPGLLQNVFCLLGGSEKHAKTILLVVCTTVTDLSARAVYRFHMCHISGAKSSYGVTKDGRLGIVLAESNCVRCAPEGLPTGASATGIRNPISCYCADCPEICIRYCTYSGQFKCIRSTRNLHLRQDDSNTDANVRWNLSAEG